MWRMTHRIAFLGLGVMGAPMAGHLARAGHAVTVFNRTRTKAEALAQQVDVAIADSPHAAVVDSDAVFMCVGNDDDVRAVVFGEGGALAAMRPGSVLVDHTTTSAELAREMAAACAARSVGFLDAPVSGGEAGAHNGTLTVMVGGDAASLAKVELFMGCYARKVALLGPSGSGQLTKMVNQICIAGLLQGLSEGLNFAIEAGLDPLAVVDVISKGAAQSWQMDNRHKSMIAGEFHFGFAVDWMRKDLGIALTEARKHNAPLPITEQVDRYFADIQTMGGSRWDTSSLIKRLRG